MDEAAFNAWCEQQPPGAVHLFVWVRPTNAKESEPSHNAT
jgi:hypothetical protein